MSRGRTAIGEGIIIVVDVGPNVRAGVNNTFFSLSNQCLINILHRKLFSEKCRDVVGIVIFGTDTTDNKLATENQYKHIKVLQEPKFVDWDVIEKASDLPRGNSQGDWLDALIVAMDLLHNSSNYSAKKIALFTDFTSEFSDSQADKIIAGMKAMKIELNVIGPNLNEDDDDEENWHDTPGPSSNNHNSSTNWNGKPKSQIQLAGEALITNMVLEVDGVISSFDEAVPQLLLFQKYSQNSANWNSVLDIGPDIQIPITGKIKIKRASIPTWKKSFAEDEAVAIISETSYHQLDDAQTVVDEEDIIFGYRYGTTLVPYSDEYLQMDYNSNATSSALSILGFTLSSNVPPSFHAGDQVLIIAARSEDEVASVALSALIQGLSQLEMVAITRKIYRKNSNPVMGVLYPDITPEYECLIWLPLPYQEDIRSFAFPTLKRVIENLTNDQKQAMDDLITSMSLSSHEMDDDEMEPHMVLNPKLQYYYTCLTSRALHPDDPLPLPPSHVTNILSAPKSVQEKGATIVKKISSLFHTTKREEKYKKENVFSDVPTSTALLNNGNSATNNLNTASSHVTKITSISPLEDFCQLLQGENPNYSDICRQMSDTLFQLTDMLCGHDLEEAFLREKIINVLKGFREEVLILDPSPYNAFIYKLKEAILGRKMALLALWTDLQRENLGLVSQSESLKSTVTAEAAREFYQLDTPKPDVVNNDYDDLLEDF